MDRIRFCILALFLQCSVVKSASSMQIREWGRTSAARPTEGDVVCFSEYMEVWIHRARIEELSVWLSGALNIQVSLASLDHLNLQLSACGFSLHKDPDDSYVFRVGHTGCFVQQQDGFNVLTLNLVKRINRYGSRPHSFTMKCPAIPALQSREQIRCDPEYIQVIREVPYGNWDSEWSLCLDDHLLVALEDASLIQVNVDVTVANISVQGRRSAILSPLKIVENEGDFLALKLVRGRYSYSMEAACPKVNTPTADKTVLHILKRPMGLTRRATYHNEALTVGDVSVNQTDTFTLHESSEFVALSIPTAQILQTKPCAGDERLLQPFYRVDVVLTFRETNHKMHWTMENTLPCAAGPGNTSSLATPSPGPNVVSPSTLGIKPETVADLSADPEGNLNQRDPLKPAELPTTHFPRMPTEAHSVDFHADELVIGRDNVSSVFENDTTIYINATETFFF